MTKADRDVILRSYEETVYQERVAYGRVIHLKEEHALWLAKVDALTGMNDLLVALKVKQTYRDEAFERGRQRAFRTFDYVGWKDACNAI